MNAFTIKDLENLSGIKAHTIRIWEQRYSFLNPQRTDTNIRYYSNHELQTVLNIALLNKYGFKISHIDRMNADEMNNKIMSLTQQEAQLERMVNDLIFYLAEVKMDEFEQLIDKFILLKGIEKTITQLLFPFLERIGILWLTNHINPAQEHLATNIIRQKLIVGINAVKTPVTAQSTALLFLPEGEHHEIGLLFAHYLFKSHGVKVMYLGANVPVKDVAYVVKMQAPDLLYSHLTSVGNSFHFDKFMAKAGETIPNKPFVVSGGLVQNYKKKIPANFSFKKSIPEVIDFITALP